MQLTLPGLISTTAPLPGVALVPLPGVQYTQTAWHSPTTEAADLTIGGDKNEKGFETHPTYAFADEGSGYAESRDNGAAGGDEAHTDRHAYWDYGLSIDPGALIRGIEVRLDWWLDAVPPAGEPAWLGAELSWDGGTSWTPIKIDDTPVSGGEEVSILGGPADTWGHVWTASELSDANFRVRLSAYSSNVARDFYLDWVPVRVYYMLDLDPASSSPDEASYDYFELCPLDREPPPTRLKPPGLRECANVVVNGTFPENTLAPWLDGTESAAVVPRGGYSCDSSGRANYGYSMLLRCDRMQTGMYAPFHPWAYQEFTVPTFVTSTQPLSVEVAASLYYLEPLEITAFNPISGLETYQGTYGSAADELRLRVTDAMSTTELASQVVAHGGSDQAAREHWHGKQIDLGQSFTIADYAGQDLRLWIDAPNRDHDGDGEEDGDTLFYVDQVRLDICTEAQPPPVPTVYTDTTRKLGGYVRVFLDGYYRPMTGVDVWAIELPPDTGEDGILGYYSTYSVHDPATGDTVYSFYDLSPGTYQVYAQVWIGGRLYWGALATPVELPVNTEQELFEITENLLLHN
jgi:hypothetical protein